MPESTEAIIQRVLPCEQAEWFLQARSVYLQARYTEALALDQKLLGWAKQAKHPKGMILGHRFIGLCHFRLDEPNESEQHLRAAIALADNEGLTAQALLCANHLGATLRRQGKLYDAYTLFRENLKKATLPEFLHERARLHGNLGALYDVFGQRAARDDHYARMEELCELLGNPDRLANARGLAARSLFQRKEQDAARLKFEEERRLATQSNNVARQIAATIHIAKLHAQKKEWNEALSQSQQAIDQATALKHPGRLIDAWECRAAVLLRQGNLAASYLSLQEAMTLLDKGSEHLEKRANVHSFAGRLCIQAGLHGEALHHLMAEADLRFRLIEPLREDEQVREMAKGRLRALEQRAHYLLRETWSVARKPDEHEAVRALLCKLLDRDELSDDDLKRLLDGGPSTDLRRWQQSQRKRARRLWQERLLPRTFALLLSESQEDLLRAEVSYSSTVDDLARFAHLLAVVVERELRARIIRPATAALQLSGKESDAWLRLGLGGLLMVLSGEKPSQRELQSSIDRMQRHVANLGVQHAAVLDAVRKVNQPVQPTGRRGSSYTLVALRNAVAHGSDTRRFKDLDRLTVDAIKRRLVLEDDPPLLAQITNLPLATSEARRPK